MSLIKKPSELEITQSLTAMVYGQPGIGKTTLACSSPDPVLFDFDGGATRLNAGHLVPTVQIRRWEDAIAALDEVRASAEIRTIIIDTAGKMMTYLEEYIMRENPTLVRGGRLTLQGYGKRKQIFNAFNQQVRIMGRNIIYVAHEIEQKRGEDTIIRPEVGGSSVNDLMKDLDLVGYMQQVGQDRTITFEPSEKFYAKNSCGMYGIIAVPKVVDENDEATGLNNFMQGVIYKFYERQLSNKANAKQFEDLCAEIRDKVAEVANAEDANNFISWMQGAKQIYYSATVAKQLLSAKAQELGLTYNKAEQKYVDPER